MKTYKTVALLMFLGAATLIQAQSEKSEKKAAKRAAKMEQLESKRTAFVVERLNMSPEEEQDFLPVYHKFRAETKALRKEGREAKKNVDFSQLTDDQARELIKLRLQKAELQLKLKREYMADLERVISPIKILELGKAEREFKREVLNRFKNRRAKRQKR